MKNKIEDFGEKIGGARKDLWRKNGLQREDLYEMNEAEKERYVTRDYVWPLPDAKKQVENGLAPFIAYWQRTIRRKVFAKPKIFRGDDFDAKIEAYVIQVREIKAAVEEVVDEAGIYAFNNNFRHKCYATRYTYWRDIVVARDIYKAGYDLEKLKARCAELNFPYNEKDVTERKAIFIPPALENIEREGEDYRQGRNVTPEMWQKDFFFRGVEFGHWTSQKVRQLSLNHCYDALMDMAVSLGIDDHDIAFGGKLALAFGSRGSNRGAAHYEPDREVISLTKMRGAGCTAHEWMHALDDRLGKWCGIESGKLASESEDDWDKLPKSFVKLVKALKHDEDGRATDYFVGSTNFNKHYQKDSHGYWDSNAEMLARAFACYIKDTYDRKSDYLFAHADVYKFEFENQAICAIPQDGEREYFDELFDQMFEELKEIGFFSRRVARKEVPVTRDPEIIPFSQSATADLFKAVITDKEGQLAFIF